MSVRPINFRTSCVKTLTAVEAELSRSTQHEFNGVIPLKNLFGENKIEMSASFSIRGSDEVFAANMTWYDARTAHATRTEHRLYFQSNPVMEIATEGDNIIIGFDLQGNVHCELIPQGTTEHEPLQSWVTR